MSRLYPLLEWFTAWFTPRRGPDVRVMLLCLTAATTFWLLNALNREYATRLNVPIRFRYDDRAYVPVRDLPATVPLNVTANGWTLLRRLLPLDHRPVEYPLDQPLRSQFLTAAAVLDAVSPQLSGLRINYVVNDTLHLNFDRLVRRTCRLALDSTALALDKTYVVTSAIRVVPARVTLEGPEATLARLGERLWLQLPPGSITEDVRQSVDISLPEAVRADVQQAEVSFTVESLIGDTRAVLVRHTHRPDSTAPAPSQRVKVQYLVRKRDALRVSAADFVVTADHALRHATDSLVVLYVEQYPRSVRNVRLESPFIRVHAR